MNVGLWCLIFSKLIDAIIDFNVLIGVFIRYYLMCEYEPSVLSADNTLLAVNIVLQIYLLTEKFCL